MKTPGFLHTFAALLLVALPAHARSWKEAGSDRKFDGDYLRTENGVAIISRLNGGTVKVALDRLSEEDRKFIAEQDASKTAASTETKDVFKWETDFDLAKKRAKEENKAILIDFTGSDWCGWCIKLNKEVFSTPEFQEYAAKKLIMVELDYPRKKELPAKLKEQNEKLQEEYKIEGFPTVILLNSRGKEVARTGYQDGGPAKYIEHVKELLK
jgi:thioredoxin-related protein